MNKIGEKKKGERHVREMVSPGKHLKEQQQHEYDQESEKHQWRLEWRVLQ